MSIRVLLCFLFVAFFCWYAWKNHFVSLCAALVMMAVLQHPDMPKSIAGIQGLNLWNILFLNVFLAWRKQRTEAGWDWDLPAGVSRLLIAFVIVIFWAFARLVLDPSNLDDYSPLSAFSEYFINNVKWLALGVLFFDSCRTEQRVKAASICIVALYFLLAVQVIRWVPLSAAVESNERFSKLASKAIQNEIGYNRVTLSMMLGGACWAAFALTPVFQRKWIRLGVLGAAGIIAVGQALTGGRTGYASWALVGFILCVVRWRYLLPVIPVAIAAVIAFMPGVRDRMLAGVGGQQGSLKIETDQSTMTSGRTTIWPYVIRDIRDNPIIGYGRLAMQRTGLTKFLIEEEDENFAHPHNAYLEQLFDNGIIGFMVVVPLYFLCLARSFPVFLDKSHVLYGVGGGIACALVLALMIGSIGGQTFYPREGSVGMWAAIGVALRLSVERIRSRVTGLGLFETALPNDGEEDQDVESFPIEDIKHA